MIENVHGRPNVGSRFERANLVNVARVLSIISRGVNDNSHETELLIISSDLSKSRLGQEWMKKSLRGREMG